MKGTHIIRTLGPPHTEGGDTSCITTPCNYGPASHHWGHYLSKPPGGGGADKDRPSWPPVAVP